MGMWIISGAQKGVGKTHLAKAMCESLPQAVYLKLGHCPAKPAASPLPSRHEEALNALAKLGRGHEHTVMEACSLALSMPEATVVFVEARSGMDNIRPDAPALRRRADIYVGPGASEAVWRSALRDLAPEIVARLCRVFESQKCYVEGGSGVS